MPLLLARYDDAMRQGMGFNSYTQTMCIESAVEATDENMITSQTLPPKVTCSSKLFEWVSEIVHTMDISRAATIKTSRMGVHGHINVLNDAKIDDAHVSLMVSVRVMSQITNLKGSAKFLPIDGIEAGSPRFNETFGDSYISGFMRGGLFTSIISFICYNTEHKDKMMESVKKASTDSTMDLNNICKVAAIASVIQGVKVEGVTCATDIASILKIADKFPTRVAQNPQRTCTHESESQNATFVHTSRSTCFILGVTYGGKVYSSSEDLRQFVDNADYGTPRDWPYIHFNRETIKDEHLGKDGMTNVVFYTYSILNGVQSAVSMGTAGCMLVDQRQLATVTKETVNGANDNLLKKDSKEVKPYQITLCKGIEAPAGYSCIFQHGTLKVSPSETPFMQFENGVKFAFRNNGRFEVLDKQDEAFWSSEEAPEGQIPQRLEFCKDGRLRLWNTEEQVYRTPLMKLTRCESKMVFSSEFPYWEIYNSEGEQLWRARGLHLV
ncbi:hypothetical protein ACKLNR_014301 [Fusarium oxysporum f. sp. zingiberi]